MLLGVLAFPKLETLLGGLAQEAHSALPLPSGHTQVPGKGNITGNKMVAVQEPGLPSLGAETQLPVSFPASPPSLSIRLRAFPMWATHFTCLPATRGQIVSTPPHFGNPVEKGDPQHPVLPDVGPLTSSLLPLRLPSPRAIPPDTCYCLVQKPLEGLNYFS